MGLLEKGGVKVFFNEGMTISVPEDSFFSYLSSLCGVSLETLKQMAVTDVEHIDDKSLIFTLESLEE